MRVVQIGTNTGFDMVNRFLRSYPITYDVYLDFVLLIEPIRKLNTNIISNYTGLDNVHIENLAVVTDDTIIFTNLFCNFSKIDLTEHSSLFKSHLLEKIGSHSGHTEELIEQLTVPCETIMSILGRHFVKHLDVLFVDAEGNDCDIISSVDFSSLSIDTIVYEDRFSEISAEKELKSLLKGKGYSLFRLNGGDVIATRLDVIKNNMLHHLATVYKSNFEGKL